MHRSGALLSTFSQKRTLAYLPAVFILSAALLFGCEMPFGIGAGSGGDTADLDVRDRVEIEPGLVAKLYAPKRVAAGDSFEVRFTAENTTEDSIQVQTGACWGQPAAVFKGEQVPLVGSYQVCTMQLLTWTLPGQETRERTFALRASLNESSGSPETVGVAEPGTYALKVMLDWTVDGQKVEEKLETSIEVVAQD